MYSEALISRFLSASHAGEVEQVSAMGTEGNPTCGDVVQISLDMRGGVIEDARFKTLGCAIAIAVSDVLCELATGLTQTQARTIDMARVRAVIGEVPETREHCAQAPLDAFFDALMKAGSDQVQG
ncbi:MAG TPA: iron-sulfur cluster assembly scaffold protein [Actinomycetota bacterium]|nr:iron-sulfur cluster assembly scaffold protein [Actinomycetota bacterium]